jgi:hypothetical protein
MPGDHRRLPARGGNFPTLPTGGGTIVPLPVAAVPKSWKKAAEEKGGLWSPGGPSWLQRAERRASTKLPLPDIIRLNLPSYRQSATLLPWFRTFGLAHDAWVIGRNVLGYIIPVPTGELVPSGGGWSLLGQCAGGGGGALRYLPQTRTAAFQPNASRRDLTNTCLGSQAITSWWSSGLPAYPCNTLHIARHTHSIGANHYGTWWRYYERPYANANVAFTMNPVMVANPVLRPTPWPSVQPPVRFRPPGGTGALQPGLPTRISITPGGTTLGRGWSHKRRPPKKGEVERKFVLALNGKSTLGVVVGFSGEFGDFTESLYNALPRYLKKKEYDTVGERFGAVLREAEHIDWEKALTNLFINQVEDAVIGRIGQQVAKLNRKLGRPAGLTLGPAL